MDMRTEIKKLARIEEGPRPFLSLYLNTRWDDEQQRERIRLFTKNQLKNGYDRLKEREDWRKVYLEDQKQIERFVEGLVRRSHDEGVNGVAIFSCSSANTFFTYPSMISFENEFFLSDLPTLRPLVRLSSQYQNTLAVMVETDSARLFEISLEGLIAEFSIESYVPGRHDQGGWAQMRYQRHIKDHMDKHQKEVAVQLTELFDTGKWRRVVLIGQDRTIANFKTFLPERVKQQITDTFSMDFSEERSRVLRRIFERLFQKEKEEVSHRIQELKERTPQGGLATFGLNGTLETLNKGQIQTLYLLTSLSLPGGRCSGCGCLVLIHPPDFPSAPCPLCKGNIRMINLGEEMMRSVLRQDGEVKWVEENRILKENDGVGASLRFRSSR
ncbi:MAG: Vms1/Ankzf1 family peptidyl-tRNA hydrolase [Thermodesulfobacteriota bacterium]|nr:Vms1/Ankzf1 family peptidyl-tRNA hydrolase [Thermodesulfobacteriota bacterium]